MIWTLDNNRRQFIDIVFHPFQNSTKYFLWKSKGISQTSTKSNVLDHPDLTPYFFSLFYILVSIQWQWTRNSAYNAKSILLLIEIMSQQKLLTFRACSENVTKKGWILRFVIDSSTNPIKLCFYFFIFIKFLFCIQFIHKIKIIPVFLFDYERHDMYVWCSSS